MKRQIIFAAAIATALPVGYAEAQERVATSFEVSVRNFNPQLLNPYVAFSVGDETKVVNYEQQFEIRFWSGAPVRSVEAVKMPGAGPLPGYGLSGVYHTDADQ